MVIHYNFIGTIGGYQWLLVPILLMVINIYFMGAYKCLLMVILLMIIGGY